MTDLCNYFSSAYWRVNPPDPDPVETREWLEAFDALVAAEGRERATFLLRKLVEHARVRKVQLPPVLNTPYRNTIPLAEQPQFPGNLELEQRLSAIVRWNALAKVVRANRAHPELGGHIAHNRSVRCERCGGAPSKAIRDEARKRVTAYFSANAEIKEASVPRAAKTAVPDVPEVETSAGGTETTEVEPVSWSPDRDDFLTLKGKPYLPARRRIQWMRGTPEPHPE